MSRTVASDILAWKADRIADLADEPEARLAQTIAQTVDRATTAANEDQAVTAEAFVSALCATANAHPAATHAYLRRLAGGDLPDVRGALADFAHQYSFYSRHFTDYVDGVIAQLTDEGHRAALLENLREEQGINPADPRAAVPHAELFARFQSAIGVDESYRRQHPACSAVLTWRRVFSSLCGASIAGMGVGALGIATEFIVPGIYRQILQAVRQFTDLDEDAAYFFDLHATADVEHSDDLVQIGVDLARDPAIRPAIEIGAKVALDLRQAFWDTMLARAEAMPVAANRPARPDDNAGAEPQALYNQTAGRWRRNKPFSLSDFTGRPAVFEMCGDVRGLDVIDLGCGEGYCARTIMRRGAASLIGLDISDHMIALARQQEAEAPLGIRYRQASVTEIDAPDESFDLALAVFVFNYLTVEETRQTFAEVRRVLRPGGRFVLSVPHPCFPYMHRSRPPFFFEMEGAGYFSGRDRRHGGRIFCLDGSHLDVQVVHKTMEDYFQAFAAAGFQSLPELRELRVREKDLAENPDFFGPVHDVPLHVGFAIAK